MKKVTSQIARAFMHHQSKSVGNTCTDGQRVYLHGNLIAERREDGTIWATLAGWPTVTTRERVNGIINTIHQGIGGFYQSKHVQYFGDRPVGDTEWVKIGEI
jgi:hypothetical protein